MNEKEKDTNQDNLDKVIEVCTYDTYPVDMEEGVNNKEDDEQETQNEYEGLIHRDITDNERETNQDTWDKVI